MTATAFLAAKRDADRLVAVAEANRLNPAVSDAAWRRMVEAAREAQHALGTDWCHCAPDGPCECGHP